MLPRKILFSTDFSENSEPAGRIAREYAETFKADIEIVYIIETWTGYPANEGGIHYEVMEAFQRMSEAAQAKLAAMATEFSRPGHEVQVHSETGVPADEIVRIAKETGADMIVLGTHGWTGIRHLLMGSVAEKVVKGAHCPVLVVRSEGETGE